MTRTVRWVMAVSVLGLLLSIAFMVFPP